eukprot:TRINITY_DN20123_c0_g1_i2.p1 TRINITY_DN20123_c0_g1~~TRINITY_DN20123_c0_g1_i2.p1  ORF type:complete len:313 (-),score=52.21 TRINITY_DN20123_c0_g1_i2:48-986(-)
MGGGGGSDGGKGGKDVVEYLVAGCGAAVVSRTCIAPVERVKIIFQTSKSQQGWISIVPRVWREEGLLAFWKGNNVAVVRVMPYLSTQLASNDVYRSLLNDCFGSSITAPVRNLFAGMAAGATAVSATYPLDTVRARLAVSMMSSNPGTGAQDGMFGTLRRIWRTEGRAALYRGCWMSCVGGGIYSGVKFMTYDAIKAQLHGVVGVKSDSELGVWHRALSGAASGAVAQTIAYPVDVMRRRMQTAQGASPYRGLIHGVVTIVKEEGVTKGLYRGLTLNYLKTIPNVAIYLSLYDVFKYWLHSFRSGPVGPTTP